MKDNQSLLKGAVIGAIFVLAIFLAFFLGLHFGQKPEFYQRFPLGKKIPPYGFIPKKFNGHGTVGEVDSVGKNTFIVKDRWGALKTVTIDKNTLIRKNNERATFEDIKKGVFVIVIGTPNIKEQIIKAEVIRIFSK